MAPLTFWKEFRNLAPIAGRVAKKKHLRQLFDLKPAVWNFCLQYTNTVNVLITP